MLRLFRPQPAGTFVFRMRYVFVLLMHAQLWHVMLRDETTAPLRPVVELND